MFEVGLFWSSQNENGSGDSGQKVRTDAQLLCAAITREVSQRLVVLGADQLRQIDILDK